MLFRTALSAIPRPIIPVRRRRSSVRLLPLGRRAPLRVGITARWRRPPRRVRVVPALRIRITPVRRRAPRSVRVVAPRVRVIPPRRRLAPRIRVFLDVGRGAPGIGIAAVRRRAPRRVRVVPPHRLGMGPPVRVLLPRGWPPRVPVRVLPPGWRRRRTARRRAPATPVLVYVISPSLGASSLVASSVIKPAIPSHTVGVPLPLSSVAVPASTGGARVARIRRASALAPVVDGRPSPARALVPSAATAITKVSPPSPPSTPASPEPAARGKVTASTPPRGASPGCAATASATVEAAAPAAAPAPTAAVHSPASAKVAPPSPPPRGEALLPSALGLGLLEVQAYNREALENADCVVGTVRALERDAVVVVLLHVLDEEPLDAGANLEEGDGGEERFHARRSATQPRVRAWCRARAVGSHLVASIVRVGLLDEGQEALALVLKSRETSASERARTDGSSESERWMGEASAEEMRTR